MQLKNNPAVGAEHIFPSAIRRNIIYKERRIMAGKNVPIIELIIYTDPYCTWCWGSEPILRKIMEVYGGQVRLRSVMGGLVEDATRFQDPLNHIGGPRMARQVADHWREASGRHGMPVDAAVGQVLLYRALSFWLPILLGLLAAWRLRRQGSL